MESVSQKLISEVSYNLLVRAATKYPINFLEKLLSSLRNEVNQSSKSVIVSIIQNIMDAVEETAPICQDTGVPTFHIYLTPSISIKGDIKAAINEATIRATEEIPLRKNVIEPFTFNNSGNNTGWGVPFVYFYFSPTPGAMRIRAELKGFGGEIKSTADWIFTSTEDMQDAVLAYVLNNVLLSKGENCTPGFLGVGVGGYISEAMLNAKNAAFRELTLKNSKKVSDVHDNSLRRFEKRIFRSINRLGLGPMGYGGKTTTMGVYLERRGTQTALASVAVSQQCWAARGSEALVKENQVKYTTRHLEKEEVPVLRQKLSKNISRSANEGEVYELNTPIKIEDIIKLHIGDIIYLNGIICTCRDRAHRRMVDHIKEGKREKIPQEILDNGVIYHCGPVIAKENNHWCIKAAGPTSSSRFTNDSASLVQQGLIKVAIGKGSMGVNMVNALKGKGVYLKAVGGCAVIYQKMITQTDVKWLDLGYPEAIWILHVNRFGPLIVGIDSKGNSLTENVMEQVYENALKIYCEEGLDPHERYIQYPQTFAGLSLSEVIEMSKVS